MTVCTSNLVLAQISLMRKAAFNFKSSFTFYQSHELKFVSIIVLSQKVQECISRFDIPASVRTIQKFLKSKHLNK